jgi:hypothetical protein
MIENKGADICSIGVKAGKAKDSGRIEKSSLY